MAAPAALQEGGGDKVGSLMYSNVGVAAWAHHKGIVKQTLTGITSGTEPFASAAVGTHADVQAWSAGDAIVVVGGHDPVNAVVRKLSVDASGRLAVRPAPAYLSSGTLAFAHPRALLQQTVGGDVVAWSAAASHLDAANFGAGEPLMVIGGVELGGTAIHKLAVDSGGRVVISTANAFGGSGHANVAGGPTSTPLRTSTVIKRVRIKADSDNAAIIYVGTSSVTANEVTTTGGFQLNAGDTLDIEATSLNLANIYIHSTTAGVGVSYLYWT